MKKRIFLVITCFLLGLSGCALFPIKEDVKPTIKEEEKTGEIVEEAEKHGELLAPSAVEEGTDVQGDVIYCISPANVRDAADSSSSVIGSLRTGDEVSKVGQEGGWIEIIFEGQQGFVYEKFMSDIAP